MEYTYEPAVTEEEKTEDLSFLGFCKPDGKVGVRNEIWVIPTVGCVNNVAEAVAKRANAFVRGSVEGGSRFPILTANPRWGMIRSIPEPYWRI